MADTATSERMLDSRNLFESFSGMAAQEAPEKLSDPVNFTTYSHNYVTKYWINLASLYNNNKKIFSFIRHSIFSY